jgi:hypothetical protein
MRSYGRWFVLIAVTMTGLLLSAAAEAIPAFARQMGVPCSTCHFQHFPELNSFGRAFKESGYTMIGSEGKVEGEGVSLPVVLNGALVGYMADQKTNGPTNGETGTSRSTNQNQLQLPQQVSLFLAGRAGEHIGFESEINLTGTGSGTQTSDPGNTGLIRLKIPFVYDVGGIHAGVVPFSTGLGVADSFEVLNTGAVAVHAFNQTGAGSTGLGGMNVVSAQQYIGTATPASGVAFIASNDNFFANVARWGANQGSGNADPTSNYIRAAWTTDLIPGFDSAIGAQSWSGSSGSDPAGAGGNVVTATGLAPGVYDTNATAFDAQMLGDVRGMPLTLVASYATAPKASAGGKPNLFNPNPGDMSSFNIGAELGVIPNKATVQLGYRLAKSGQYVPGTTAGNATDNAFLIGATYALALNARLELTYVKASGDLYNGNAGSQTYLGSNAANDGVYGSEAWTLDLAFGF